MGDQEVSAEGVSPTSDNTNPPNHIGGKFAPGNKCGKGNPLAKRQAEYRKAFQDAVSLDDMKAIAEKISDQAKGGDVLSARFVADYTLGKPVPMVEAEDGSGQMVPGALVINLVAPNRAP